MSQNWHLQEITDSQNTQQPPKSALEPLEKGHRVKLVFVSALPAVATAKTEPLWVEILLVSGNQYLGQLEDDPKIIPGLVRGEMIEFEEGHILETD